MSETDKRSAKAGETLRPSDYWIGLALFFLAVAIEVPFRSQKAYHWDSAEFALAIREYNVALSQPHAPGYFLYVMLGKLMSFFVGDPHTGLVWLSVIAGGGLVTLLYILGTWMFERRVGLAAALFAMTSPQVWFHSCVALTYIVDGFFVCVAVLCCWLARRHACRWIDVVIIGVVLAILGGIRPQTIPGLLPLVVYTFWNAGEWRWTKLLSTLCVFAIATTAWLVPMITMSGGWRVYTEVFHRHATFNASATFVDQGLDAFLWNVFFASLYSLNGLMLGAVLLICALFVRVGMDRARKKAWDAAHSKALKVLILWIGPMLFTGTVAAFTKQPGYVLSYLPAWIILTAVIAGQLRERRSYYVTVAAVCAMNVFAFSAWPRSWDGVFFGNARTAREIQEHDRQLTQIVSVIRSRLNSTGTVICHAHEYLPLGLRHLQLYLPEFEQYQLAIDPVMLSPKDKPMMRIKGGRLEFVRRLNLAGKKELVLLVPQGTFLEDYASHFDLRNAKPLPGSEQRVYTIPIEQVR